MSLNSDAPGVFLIAPMPFFDDGRIDTASIDCLTGIHLGCGATGITVFGQLGEAPKPEHDEKHRRGDTDDLSRGPSAGCSGVSAPGSSAMRALTREVITWGGTRSVRRPLDAAALRAPTGARARRAQVHPAAVRTVIRLPCASPELR